MQKTKLIITLTLLLILLVSAFYFSFLVILIVPLLAGFVFFWVKRKSLITKKDIVAYCKDLGNIPLFASSFLNRSLAAGADIEIDRYLRSIFDSPSTVYDKAMDFGRNLKGEYGPDHRIFDGLHDLPGAWSAVKEAIPNDSRSEEIMGYAISYWKDLVTPMGMPVITLDRQGFEAVSQFAKQFGIQESWLKDLVSFTATEGAGAVAAILGAAMNLKEKDINKFANHAASIFTASAWAGNPLALTVAILMLARSCQVGEKQKKLSEIYSQFGWGTAKSTVFIGTAGIIGGPVWIGIIGAIATTIVVSKVQSNYEKSASEEPKINPASTMDNLIKEGIRNKIPNKKTMKLLQSSKIQ